MQVACLQDQEQSQQPRPNNRAMRRRPGRLQSAHEESCCQDPAIPHAEPYPTSDNNSITPVHPTSASVNPASALGQPAEHQLYSAQLEPHVTQPDSTTTQPAPSLTQLQSRTAQPSSLHSAWPNQALARPHCNSIADSWTPLTASAR